jgi:hypothetical protein
MNTMLLPRMVAASTQRPVLGEQGAATDPPRIAPASHGGLAIIVVMSMRQVVEAQKRETRLESLA